ncbi:MAG: NUDIX domain-containing protein [Bacteroidota bacterium]
MYKIYFYDRFIILTDDINSSGQIYNYTGKSGLLKVIKDFNNDTKLNQLFVYHHDVDLLFEVFYSCFSIITAAGGLIRNIDGQVMLIYRRNKWDLPKGKVDYGESFEKAAIREVVEETGVLNPTIVKKISDSFHTYSINNQLVLKQTCWFEMLSEKENTLIPQKEEGITQVKWFNTEDLNSVINNTYPSVIDIFKIAGLM